MRKYTPSKPLYRHKLLIAAPRHWSCLVFVVLLVAAVSSVWQARAFGAEKDLSKSAGGENIPIHVNGVFPNLTVMAKGIGRRL
jgi:hypothetical protein